MEFGTGAAFAVYLVCLLAISILSYRRAHTASDFIMGGRSLNFYVTALSAHASDMSSWLFLAYPALIFMQGGVGAWCSVGLVLGMWCNWKFVAPRLRSETERTGSFTLSHYFGKRFPETAGFLSTMGALLSLIFFTAYVSAGLVGMGVLFDSVFGIEPLIGITVGLAVVVVYTLVGGYLAICWIDLFQALFLLGMIVLVPLVALNKLGSWSTVAEVALQRGIGLSMLPEKGWAALPEIVFLALGWGLGYFGQTHILTKFMGIKDPSELNKSKWVGLVWQTLCLAGATLVGLVAIGYFPEGLANTELAFVHLVKLNFMPFVAGLVLCGIVAATISTMDSQILVLASVLVQDIYSRYLRKTASDRELLWMSRAFVMLIALAAYAIALTSSSSVMGLVFYAWSGLGSTFGAVLIAALYAKKVNGYGATAGMVFGGAVAAIWPSVAPHLPMAIPALIPGFFLNLGVIYGVSALTASRVRAVEV